MFALVPPGSMWATLPGPEAAGTVQGQLPPAAALSLGALLLPLNWPGTPQGASCDPKGLFSSSRRGHRETRGTGGASQPSFPWHWRAQEVVVPRPGQGYTVGSAASSLPAAWALPLLFRPNLRMDLREQNTEKDTPVPFRGTHTVPGHRGHSCPGM